MKPIEVSPIPPGFHSVTPYLMVADVTGYLDFLRKAFDVQVTRQYEGPDNTIAHVEVRLADSIIMICDGLARHKLMPAALYFYVTNVDTVHKQALDAGATSICEPRNEFHGDRVGAVEDGWGNIWWLATHVEDVSDEERTRRNKEKLDGTSNGHASLEAPAPDRGAAPGITG